MKTRMYTVQPILKKTSQQTKKNAKTKTANSVNRKCPKSCKIIAHTIHTIHVTGNYINLPTIHVPSKINHSWIGLNPTYRSSHGVGRPGRPGLQGFRCVFFCSRGTVHLWSDLKTSHDLCNFCCVKFFEGLKQLT